MHGEFGSKYSKKESVVKGDHVYRAIWAPIISEELTTQPEDHSDHTVSVTVHSCSVVYVPSTLLCVVVLLEA